MSTASTRTYRLARWTTLAAWWAFIIGVPAWHVSYFDGDGALANNALSDGLAVTGANDVAPIAQGAPWSVELFGFELLDPLAAVGVVLAGYPSVAILLAALPTLLLVAVLGRFFCGWLCPYVPILAASNALRKLLGWRGIEVRDVRLPRSTPYLVLAATLLATMLGATQLAAVFYPPAVIGRETLKAVMLGGFGLGLGAVLAAFLFDTFVSRAGFCRSVCPGGALFSLLSALSPVRVRRDADACIDCGVCDDVCNLGQLPMTDVVGMGCERCGSCVASCPTDALSMSWDARPPLLIEVERLREEQSFMPSRRSLVLAAAGTAAASAFAFWGPRPSNGERVRPPGALSGFDFERACIRCFRCAEVCPVGAIQFDSLLDLRGTDTPWILPAEQACILCMACTEACPTGALSPIEPDLVTIAAMVRMGTPELSRERCIPWSGRGECNACWQVCPFPDLAVTRGVGRQGPEFDPDACVGCGLCVQACPDRAEAIIVRGVS